MDHFAMNGWKVYYNEGPEGPRGIVESTNTKIEKNKVGVTCNVCGEAIYEIHQVTTCSKCTTPHHTECWDYVGHCSTFGCFGRNECQALKKKSEVTESIDYKELIRLARETFQKFAKTNPEFKNKLTYKHRSFLWWRWKTKQRMELANFITAETWFSGDEWRPYLTYKMRIDSNFDFWINGDLVTPKFLAEIREEGEGKYMPAIVIELFYKFINADELDKVISV